MKTSAAPWPRGLPSPHGGMDRLDVFYRGPNTALWHQWWGTTADNPAPMWRGPNDIGDNSGWGSWSNAPDDLEANRACLYNLKLGDDPWNDTPYLNHTLHEFEHALGLAHEHERDDVPEACKTSDEGYGGNIRDGFLTPFDKNSVMNYGPSQSPSCGIIGNYAHTGLSDLDRVALRILYPEDNHLAEYVGTTVRRAGETIVLQSGWKARGANLDFVAKDFQWVVNDTTVRSPDLVIVLTTDLLLLAKWTSVRIRTNMRRST